MDIDVFKPSELPTVFRVLRTALRTLGPLEPRERVFLQTYARITGHALPAEDPLPIRTRDVLVDGAHPRKRLVQLAALAALLSYPVRPASVEFVTSLSQHVRVHDGVVDVLNAMVRGQFLKVRLLASRRAFRVMIKEAYGLEGVAGVLRFFGALLLKAPVNRDRVWNYKRLGLLPDGTLGREYWKHMTEVGFGFPGEIAGIADSVAYHDVAHVLAENPTTPPGEIEQGCFQGGSRREDGFFFVQFVILQFHHGVRISPAAPIQVGHYDPQQALWSIHRGAKCNVDVTHRWNFWPLMSLPIDEARARIGLLPKLEPTPAYAETPRAVPQAASAARAMAQAA
jgi:hypothetical protein